MFLRHSDAPCRVVGIERSGKVYAFEDVAYWNPEKKQGRHARHCIGFFKGGMLFVRGSQTIDRIA